MFKITTKTTKKELKDLLDANAKAVKEKDTELFDRIAYADKVAKKDDSKVTRKDLVDLVKDTMKLLGDTLVVPALAEETPAETSKPKAENSTKKKLTGKKKKEEPVEEESTAEAEEEQAEEPKTTAEEKKVDEKKSAKKLGDKKKPSGDTASSSKKANKTVQAKALTVAEVFPEEFEVDGQKYVLAKDIANMGQIKDQSEDEILVFAMYWTKRHLKQFEYGGDKTFQAPANGFPNDLDLATLFYVSDECAVAYAVSRYTEVCYMFTPDDIEEVDGLRFAGGVEFQIYRLVEEEDAE